MRRKKNKEYINEQIQTLLIQQQMKQPLKGEPPGPDLGDVMLVKKRNKWILVEKKEFLDNLKKEVNGNSLVRFIVKLSNRKSDLSMYIFRKIRSIIYGGVIGQEVVREPKDDASLYRSHLHFSYQYKKNSYG